MLAQAILEVCRGVTSGVADKFFIPMDGQKKVKTKRACWQYYLLYISCGAVWIVIDN